MKKIALFVLLALPFAFLLLFAFREPSSPTQTAAPAAEPVVLEVGEAEVAVEVVDTPEKRARGLSGRTELAEGEGMLFVFDQKDQYQTFWMKDMLIPIDILWIDNAEIVKIDANAPPEPDTTDLELTLYLSEQSVDYVLEVPAGYAEANDIVVGTKVSGLE